VPGQVECPSIEEIDIESEEYAGVLQGSKKVKVLLDDCDVVRWKNDLEKDKEKLAEILKQSDCITATRDEKLARLKELICSKVSQPINKGNRKLLLFTAFADTAQYLYENIEKWALTEFSIHSALVTGSTTNRTTLPLKDINLSSILTNFSPLSKGRESTDNPDVADIDILIATDCISEGQNLQDCDMVVNYDIHWNPVRIIQRFGRIDRIGSKNEKIQLVNFWPDMELDEYINLEARVSDRMVLLDVSATGEENIIDSGNNAEGMNDLLYRKKQLEQLQKNVLDLEDISGGISITDLTLNDFRMDLTNYMNANPGELPCGVPGSHAIVTRKPHLQNEIPAGVIFCVKHVDIKKVKAKDQPLAPYSLVFVTNDGQLSYAQGGARKILDLYRSLCKDECNIDAVALTQFQNLTANGSAMEPYSDLLRKAAAVILGKEDDAGIGNLFDSTCDTLGFTTCNTPEDLECISWLVIL